MLLLTPQGSGAHDTHVYSMGRALAAKGAPATVLPHAHDSRTSLTQHAQQNTPPRRHLPPTSLFPALRDLKLTQLDACICV
jgi:hypothetical protein